MNIHSSFIYESKTGADPKCPSTGKRINKLMWNTARSPGTDSYTGEPERQYANSKVMTQKPTARFRLHESPEKGLLCKLFFSDRVDQGLPRG